MGCCRVVRAGEAAALRLMAVVVAVVGWWWGWRRWSKEVRAREADVDGVARCAPTARLWLSKVGQARGMGPVVLVCGARGGAAGCTWPSQARAVGLVMVGRDAVRGVVQCGVWRDVVRWSELPCGAPAPLHET